MSGAGAGTDLLRRPKPLASQLRLKRHSVPLVIDAAGSVSGGAFDDVAEIASSSPNPRNSKFKPCSCQHRKSHRPTRANRIVKEQNDKPQELRFFTIANLLNTIGQSDLLFQPETFDDR